MKRNEFPVLSKCLKNEIPELNDLLNNNNDEKFNYNDNRNSYLTIGYYNTWKHNCIPRLIKRLKTKYQLTWIRTRMAYRRFENIEEMMLSHTNNMVMIEWVSRDFKPRDSNCNIANKNKDGKCMCNGQCRTSKVVSFMNFNVKSRRRNMLDKP